MRASLVGSDPDDGTLFRRLFRPLTQSLDDAECRLAEVISGSSNLCRWVILKHFIVLRFAWTPRFWSPFWCVGVVPHSLLRYFLRPNFKGTPVKMRQRFFPNPNVCYFPRLLRRVPLQPFPVSWHFSRGGQANLRVTDLIGSGGVDDEQCLIKTTCGRPGMRKSSWRPSAQGTNQLAIKNAAAGKKNYFKFFHDIKIRLLSVENDPSPWCTISANSNVGRSMTEQI